MVSEADKAQKYLVIAHVGAAAMIGLVVAFAVKAPDFVQGFFVGLMLVLVAALFRSRMRDEYIERLWNAGTAAAFITALAMTVVADLARGFASQADDVFAVSVFTPPQVGLAVLAAFYLTFHLSMLRDRG